MTVIINHVQEILLRTIGFIGEVARWRCSLKTSTTTSNQHFVFLLVFLEEGIELTSVLNYGIAILQVVIQLRSQCDGETFNMRA